MSRYRNAALAVGAWLLVVTGGAVLVWTVISQAGEGVAGAPPVVQAGSSDPSGRPSSTQSSPGGTPSSDPTASSGAVRGTWNGAGGVVIAECSDGAITLVSTYPDSGWKYEVDERGPASVRVEFETSDEETRVRVEGVCADAAPSFSVDTRTKG